MKVTFNFAYKINQRQKRKNTNKMYLIGSSNI